MGADLERSGRFVSLRFDRSVEIECGVVLEESSCSVRCTSVGGRRVRETS